WEGYTHIGDGSFTPGDPGSGFYDYSIVRRCNEFLDKVPAIKFGNDADKKDLIAQVRFIRLYKYFMMNWHYGGVQIIENYQTAEEAQIPRNTEAQVKKFIDDEMALVLPDIKTTPSARGRIAKGAALALKMRMHLYYNEYPAAYNTAKEIQKLQMYDLEDDYSELFNISGQGSKEIILASQYMAEVYTLGVIGQMFNNSDGGWSSIVPTHNLVDIYETADGLSITEAKEKGTYDDLFPYVNRDPRLYMTILYPGDDRVALLSGKAVITNTIDKMVYDEGKKKDVTNPDYFNSQSNCSKTGYTWKKYLFPANQYSNVWSSTACPIVFRYAEVLLTIAESLIEQGTINDEVYNSIDLVRERAGMPAVNRAKYADQASLRELIRRERTVEFAGEGIHRADIVRWKDASGKMVAETVMNQPVYRCPISKGEVNENGKGGIDYTQADPHKRAQFVIDADHPKEQIVEKRKFAPYNRYYPIPLSDMDKNPNMENNPGYI
ncbi:MAG: RagB/SusD family nutrient uptake outer membrane protein, partial [Rikenellaceae bacterium]